jgi:hypothetical protein
MATTAKSAGNKTNRGNAKNPTPDAVVAGGAVGPKGRRLKDTSKDVPAPPPEQLQGEQGQQQANDVARFQPTVMETPAVHAEQLAAPAGDDKQVAFMEAMKAMAEKMGVPLPPALANPQAAQPAKQAGGNRGNLPTQNNITHPAKGTVTGSIWEAADEISVQKKGVPATIGEVRQHANLKQVNENTIKTQYARWRAYHGIKGRQGPQGGQAQQDAKSPEGHDEGIEQAWGRRKDDVDRRAPQEEQQPG